MSKPNKRHHEKCEKYKAQGRRETNKEIRKQRHEKRMQKFAKRREEGKAYTYEPNPFESGTAAFAHEKAVRAYKHNDASKDRIGEFQRLARFFGRINRDIQIAREEERMEEIKKHKPKSKGKVKKGQEVDEAV